MDSKEQVSHAGGKRYRATIVPPNVAPEDIEVQAEHGALPFVQFKAANSSRAAHIAHALTGRPVLKVERIEEPGLTAFQITYSPAHRACGTPRNPTASRQVLAERRTITVRAPHADAAVWAFERDTDRMATACRRLQDVRAEQDEGEEEPA